MNIYLTDKTGKRFFKTSIASSWAQGELRTLNRHLMLAKKGVKGYAFIDAETARLVQEPDKWDNQTPELTDDELLSALAS